jgi:hypothetical protein
MQSISCRNRWLSAIINGHMTYHLVRFPACWRRSFLRDRSNELDDANAPFKKSYLSTLEWIQKLTYAFVDPATSASECK